MLWIVSAREMMASLITGSAKVISDVIDCCFNMNGAKPPGQQGWTH
jgi:hypothetical protein